MIYDYVYVDLWLYSSNYIILVAFTAGAAVVELPY